MTEGRWDASRYDSDHSFVWEHAGDLLKLLAPKAGEKILDLGCGTGHLTAQIAESGASVVGIDGSDDMVRQASKNYSEILFDVQDARSMSFDNEFDAVFSNAVLHWIRPPEEVVESVWRALKPGGRFVAEFGGKGNINAILAAVNGSLDTLESGNTAVRRPDLYFPTIGEYAALLEQHGFYVAHAAHFERPTVLNGGKEGMRTWLQMFGRDYLAPLSPRQRDQLIMHVEEVTRPMLYHNGEWVADYKRIRVQAFKPE